MCELHGNLFMEVCSGCGKEFRRTADVGGVGFKPTGNKCKVFESTSMAVAAVGVVEWW